jgi:CRISPR-associated exonuclease Cas4/CRISPR-associated protein Cas1
MVNEYVYCPRLAFLEWVDGEWADSGDTEEGRRAHVQVDAGGGKLPPADEIGDKPDFVARSVMLASETLGIIAKMDLVEGEDGTVTPIDSKKGKRAHSASKTRVNALMVPEGAYEPERVQVCAQALILEDAGYKVGEGAIGTPARASACASSSTVTFVQRPARRSRGCGSPPRRAGCRRRWSTARNARGARSPASACRTR